MSTGAPQDWRAHTRFHIPGLQGKVVTHEWPGPDVLAGLAESPGEARVGCGSTLEVEEYPRNIHQHELSQSHHFGTKTWPHSTAYRLQSWEASGQTTNRVGTQPHPGEDRLYKVILTPEPPLTTPLDPVHQRDKTQLHPLVGRHHSLP